MPAEVFEEKSTGPAPAAAAVPLPPLPPDEGVTHQCANCLAPLAGPFCAQCGQHVADYHRSVWRFVAAFFDNAFCWDNKLFRTLGPLLKRPGWLTQEFMAGRRVRYVHPLRLFLFTSAVCLTLIQFMHRDAGMDRGKDTEPGATIQAGDGKDGDEKTPAASPAPTPTTPLPPASPAEATLGQVFRETYKPSVKGGKPINAATAEKPGLPRGAAGGGDDFQDKMEAVGKKMEAAGRKMEAAEKAGKFGEKLTTNLQQKLSWVTLAMLPIFALLMRWAYGRAGGYYFTYLVFSLHYHTFLLLFWVVYSSLDAMASRVNNALFQLPGFLVGLCLLLPPYYLYRALRQMYGQSRFATVAKVSAVGALHLLALFVGLAIIGATSFL